MKSEKETNNPESVTVVPINSDEENGFVQISNNVIAAIVRKYTLSVDGVIRFASQSIMDGLADILSRRSYERSIVIDLKEEGAEITLTLIMRFGAVIPEVSAAVQKIVKEKVKEFTGYDVIKVNINIAELEDEEDAPEDAPTVEALVPEGH
ncbi:MAG: Asp23/Gls24 family envelope stress response protein [Lentisphaerae bacterium]|jgi:uncharacterized alkaline shock family protein YloU|nr:Asp23/Gls24 family envelope stress response protein [Lentisphaerota bacterium]